MKLETVQRNEDIIKAIKSGENSEAVASRYGITRETVRWIVRKVAPGLKHLVRRKLVATKETKYQRNKDIKEMYKRLRVELYHLQDRDVRDIVGRNFSMSADAIGKVVHARIEVSEAEELY